MTMIAVTTTLDEGVSEALAEALDDAEIPCEVRRLGINAYLGAATPVSFEIRVPEDRIEEARAVLAALEKAAPVGESESPADAESRPAQPADADTATAASAPAQTDEPDDPDEPGDVEDDAPAHNDKAPPAERVPRLWMVVPLGIVGVAPVSCLYARWPRLGFLFLSTGIASLIGFFATRNGNALALAVGVKAVDMVLAPLLLTIENHRRSRGSAKGIAQGAVVSFVCLALFASAGLYFRHQQKQWQLETDSTALFAKAVERIKQGELPLDEQGQLPTFPDVPAGKVHRGLIEYAVNSRTRLQAIIDSYQKQRAQWHEAGGDDVSVTWPHARKKEAAELVQLLDQQEGAWDALENRLVPYLVKDARLSEFFDQVRSSAEAAYAKGPAARMVGPLRGICAAWNTYAQNLIDGEQPSRELLDKMSTLEHLVDIEIENLQPH